MFGHCCLDIVLATFHLELTTFAYGLGIREATQQENWLTSYCRREVHTITDRHPTKEHSDAFVAMCYDITTRLYASLML
jgi:hypothetical protein